MIILDTSNVEFSRWDRLHNVRVPSILTPSLAYETGLHIGDGSLPLFRSRSNIYRIHYSGNSINEMPFYIGVIKPLLKELYNRDVKVIERRKNECSIGFGSKAIFTFKSRVLGLPISYKDEITIPPIILTDRKLALSCLRGIADADFSLVFLKKYKDVHYYPKVKGDSKSRLLMEQIEWMVKRFLNLHPVMSYDVKRYDERTGKTRRTSTIELNGRNCLRVWMENVGFSNTSQMSKFLVWKKLGYLPKLSIRK